MLKRGDVVTCRVVKHRYYATVRILLLFLLFLSPIDIVRITGIITVPILTEASDIGNADVVFQSDRPPKF